MEVGYVAHLENDVGRERADTFQERGREERLVACDHNNGHRLAEDGAQWRSGKSHRACED